MTRIGRECILLKVKGSPSRLLGDLPDGWPGTGMEKGCEKEWSFWAMGGCVAYFRLSTLVLFRHRLTCRKTQLTPTRWASDLSMLIYIVAEEE